MTTMQERDSSTGEISAVPEHLRARRERVAEAWRLHDQIVLIGAGEQIPLPGGADRVFPYIPHAEYRYLAEQLSPGGVVAFDPRERKAGGGGWTDFVHHPSAAELMWENPAPVRGEPLSELCGWLAARRGRPVALLGSAIPGIEGDERLALCLREALMQVRRPKDPVELAKIGEAVRATEAGFAKAVETIRPGVTELAVQIELEAEFRRHGAQRPGYDTIVAAGPNAAVLHFAPSDREIGPDNLVLIDAGAEVDGYCADVTRTMPASGELKGARRDLYHAVLRAQERAVAACVPGAEYRELHLAAAKDLAEGLVGMGVLKGDPQELVDRDAHAMFFPHGLGHLVGLGVRDASGYLPGRERSSRFGLGNLRMDLPLDEGYVVTIEPGLYFIERILREPGRRECYADCVEWSRVDELLADGIGGVRIEDDVLVTRDGPENLTVKIPKAG